MAVDFECLLFGLSFCFVVYICRCSIISVKVSLSRIVSFSVLFRIVTSRVRSAISNLEARSGFHGRSEMKDNRTRKRKERLGQYCTDKVKKQRVD